MQEQLKNLLFYVVLSTSTFFTNGFTIMKLYNWFISSLYELSPIVFWQGFGFSLFVSYFLLPLVDSEKNKDISITDRFLNTVLKCSLFLLIGWVVSTYFL